jgi:protein-S-isoprenylcysteine O-methyltransferase Ste14
MLVWTILLFARVGKGTLAPWQPTQQLVIRGPYKYTRNPMISGVVGILTGEALWFNSWPILVWAGIFFCINTLYFIKIEEPSMMRRFGESYLQYKRAVPRWLPRLTPYESHEKA